MDTSSFDTRLFLDYLGNDLALARELLSAFAEDAPVRLEALTRAVGSGDCESAVRAAHSLKGMCGVLKDQPAQALALNMEAAARIGDLDALRAGVPELSRVLARILAQVSAFLAA